MKAEFETEKSQWTKESQAIQVREVSFPVLDL